MLKGNHRSSAPQLYKKHGKALVVLFILVVLVLLQQIEREPAPSLEAASIEPIISASTRNNDLLLHLQTREQQASMLQACPQSNRLQVSAEDMTMDDFIDRFFEVLRTVEKDVRPITWVLRNFEYLVNHHGALSKGSWTEFGVFEGSSLKQAFDLLKGSSFGDNIVMAGFDSFQGLPVKWRAGYDSGHFQDGDQYERVRKMFPPQVEIYKGWFQDTIGTFLKNHPNQPATLIHHDGDLFVSTAITFSLMNHRIVPGTLLCFDEIMGYPHFEQHEILSLFVWMKDRQATLCPIAVKGPLEKQKMFILSVDHEADKQSACFQVIQMEG